MSNTIKTVKILPRSLKVYSFHSESIYDEFIKENDGDLSGVRLLSLSGPTYISLGIYNQWQGSVNNLESIFFSECQKTARVIGKRDLITIEYLLRIINECHRRQCEYVVIDNM